MDLTRARRRRRLLVVLLLVSVGLALTAVVFIPGSGGSGICTTRSRACLFVDGASRGGHCSDARSVRKAHSRRTPWCTLARAVEKAPAGATIAVRGGSYPRLVIAGLRRGAAVTLTAYPGERAELTEGFEITHSDGFVLRGFHVLSRGGMSSVTGSSRITIDRSDFSGAGLILRAVRRTTVSRNRIHDVARGSASDGFAGYGIWANGYLFGSGGGIDGLLISRNTFRNIPQDAIQLGGGTDLVAHVMIERNNFGPVRRALQADHPDPIQVLGGRGVVIRSNYFHDSEDAIIVKDGVTTGLVVSNNLMVGWPGGCIQAQFWNTPGARVSGNTIWRSSCIGLRFASDAAVGPDPSGLVVLRNIVDSYALPDSRWVARQDYNVILRGPRLGPHDTGRRPRFGRGYRPLGVARRLGAGSTVRPH